MTPAPADLHHAALDALAGVRFNVGFARSALGAAPGPLWADRADDPRAFHVVHPCGMSLVWGPAVDAVLPAVVAHLRSRQAAGHGEWLQVEPRWTGLGWDAALGAVPASEIDPAAPPAVVRYDRLNFAFDAAAHRSALPRLAPPDGWRVRAATAADFPRDGTVVPRHYWPDAATFLAHGGGAVVEQDGTVGAVAFTSFRDGTDLEIGIETVPEHRGKGLARAAAAALIRDATEAGLVPVWSCADRNAGSAALARSLGFAPTSRTPYHRLVAAPV